MERINTVTGTCKPAELGRTLVHEHLLIGFPGWEMDALAPRFKRAEARARAVEWMHRLQGHGVSTFLDPCPIDLGRDPEFMAEVAQASGMRIICTTGAYFEEQGLTYTFRNLPLDDIAAIYQREIEEGIGETGIRAGLIKVATGAHRVSDYERKLLIAAGRAATRCDVPIITHTQDGCAGPEQQKLFAEGGVGPHRCLIGHCCGNADPAYHRRVCEGGSYIGFDRIGLTRFQPDEVRADNLVKLVRAGYRASIMMSQDRHCGWLGKLARQVTPEEQARIDRLQAEGDWPPPYTYLFTDFVPMLRQRGLSDAEIFAMLDDNPRRFFAGEPLPLPNM